MSSSRTPSRSPARPAVGSPASRGSVRGAPTDVSQPTDPVVDPFRTAFFETRKALIHGQGADTFDQAQVLYVCSITGKRVVVRDSFAVERGHGGVLAFVQALTEGWWKTRQAFAGEAAAGTDLRPVAGLYARYLPEVGFDYVLEVDANGPVRAHRMNARGKVWPLAVPADDAMFHDQTGTWFSVRAGWRQLVRQCQQTGHLHVGEVQSGYVIGVRRGVPGHPDPAEREDPELEEVFSTFAAQAYDTLEFLNGPEAAALPFAGERLDEWLDEADAASDAAGALDLFVLAESSAFLECIEDVAKELGVAVAWIDPENDLRVAFIRDDLRVECGFAEHFLSTLHTGRSFVEGAQAAYGPTVQALADAHELLAQAREGLVGHAVTVEDGVVLAVRDPAGHPVARFNLLGLASRQAFNGAAARDAFLRYLGWDTTAQRFVRRGESLAVCPVTGAPARVGKVVRPQAGLGVDPRTLMGIDLGAHLVFFTQESATHTTPVEPGPGLDLGTLELAYRDGLPAAVTRVVGLSRLDQVTIFVGFDVGSLVIEPGRVAALLAAVALPVAGAVTAWASHPDALVVSPTPLEGPARARARATAQTLVNTHFPGRGYALDLSRTVALDGVEALGQVELEG